MLEQLRFVNNAVDTKANVTEMQHLVIENGHVRSTNGLLSMGIPLQTDLKCVPNADLLLKAVRTCKDVVSLSMTNGGQLRVKSGKFRALVPCSEDIGVHAKPAGADINLDGATLKKAFETLEDFVSADVTRPWANSVLLKGQSAFATNNLSIIEVWLGADMPNISIPLTAVKHVNKQNANPSRVLADGSSITFMYEDGRWIKSLLYEDKWPDVSPVLSIEATPREIPDGFFDGLKAVEGFSQGYVYFQDGKVCSSPHAAEGAAFDVDGLPAKGAYNLETLKLLKGVATHFDLDRYPENGAFFGDNIRGVVMSMRA